MWPTQLGEEITARIEERLQTYLELPYSVNQSNAHAIALAEIDILTEPERLERYFWNQIQTYKFLSTIYLGTDRGHFSSAKRMPDGKLRVAALNASTDGKALNYVTDDQGNRRELVKVTDYDPRQRPWYQQAVELERPTWSEVYPDFTTKGMAITAAHPLYDGSGDLTGVLGIDLLFVHFNEFLNKLDIGKNGETFIIERSGLLISTSTLDPIFTVENEETIRLAANNSDNDLIRTTGQELFNRFSDLAAISAPQTFTFPIAGEQQFVRVTPLMMARGRLADHYHHS